VLLIGLLVGIALAARIDQFCVNGYREAFTTAMSIIFSSVRFFLIIHIKFAPR
jgi:uncharacterized membrane protein